MESSNGYRYNSFNDQSAEDNALSRFNHHSVEDGTIPLHTQASMKLLSRTESSRNNESEHSRENSVSVVPDSIPSLAEWREAILAPDTVFTLPPAAQEAQFLKCEQELLERKFIKLHTVSYLDTCVCAQIANISTHKHIQYK